jgi:hypothetical protein
MSAMSCFGVALMVFCGIVLAWAVTAPIAYSYSMVLSGPRVSAGSDRAFLIGALAGILLGAICAIVGARGNKEEIND